MARPAGVSTEEWVRFRRDLGRFEPTLQRALRRQIRMAGEDAARAVRSAVRLPAPTSGGDSVGAREQIARATRITHFRKGKGYGTRVVTDDVRGGFSKAYNKASFRHPVYGSGTWVEQQGRPYFGSAISKTMRVQRVIQIRLALDEAVRAIGAKGI